MKVCSTQFSTSQGSVDWQIHEGNSQLQMPSTTSQKCDIPHSLTMGINTLQQWSLQTAQQASQPHRQWDDP